MGQLEEGKLEQQPQVVQAAYEYLSSLPYGLWAHWYIKGEANEQNRLQAAEWLVEQMKGVYNSTTFEIWMTITDDGESN